ncbi:MAG: glycoside hydrolase family protein [Burkholderiales bacterium]
MEEEWQPNYGNNNGFSKEKNWVFFEHDKKLHCIYSTDPEHVILEMDGANVVREYRTKGPLWHWGHMRGGTPPVDMGDGTMMCIFHSSIPTEIPPHYVRYYAAAYTFESKPPFRIISISEQPILSGSEEDGHRVDPRYVEGWKPYVVFPCGLVPDNDGWLVSFGINDWQCAIGRIRRDQLSLGATDGSTFKPRYFRVNNGTIPVRYVDIGQRPVFIHWDVIRAKRGCSAGTGYMKAANAREAVEVSEQPGVVEITESDYQKVMRLRENVYQ